MDKKSSIYGRRAPDGTNKVERSKHPSQNSKGAGKKSAATSKKTTAVSKAKTESDNKAILADLKGVDKQLAETILDEVVERYNSMLQIYTTSGVLLITYTCNRKILLRDCSRVIVLCEHN